METQLNAWVGHCTLESRTISGVMNTAAKCVPHLFLLMNTELLHSESLNASHGNSR